MASPIDNGTQRNPRVDQAAPILARVEGVSKSFGGVHALNDAQLELRAGEVHALCGENGAGKSTLIRILAGIYAPDAGKVVIDGRFVRHGIDSADDLGVAVIHQESVACPDLDAVDNIFVGREPRRLSGLLLDRSAMQRQTRELLTRLGETIDIFRPTAELPMAQRQMIGIARALSQRCRLLIMDEPTASLSERETHVLFRIITQLRDQGVAILYVTHRLEEVFALANRVTVLRDGKNVATRPIGELTANQLIELMVGREIEPLEDKQIPPPDPVAAVLLDVQGLTSAGRFKNVSVAIRAGEVVGLAGLVGAGRSELALAIFGIAGYDEGAVHVSDSPLPPNCVAGSIRRGLALVPEDRQRLGLVLPMSMAANLSLIVLRSLTKWGIIRRQQEHDLALRLVKDLDIRAAGTSLPAETLSGGNQQKLVLGKWLATQPRVLILDEPTRGVDVGAKAEIHRRIRQMASEGMATLVISSELPELLRLCDRIAVMRDGQIAGEIRRHDANEQKVLELALPLGTTADRGHDRQHHESAFRRLSAARQLLWRREVWLAAMLLATVSFVGAMSPSFLSPTNLLDIVADAAPVAIMACAVTLVIVTGEIDISVGSLLGLTAAILGILCYGDSPLMSVPAAVICSLFVALGIGAINGLLVTRGGVPSIIATLAMLTVLRGITKLIMRGTDIHGRPEPLREFATGRMLGIPISVWIAFFIASFVWILTRYTPLGRRIYAVGSNPKAAPLLGISAGLTRFFVLAFSGLLAGVAAIVLAPKNSLIQPNMGESLELLVVTCVVVGGTSISGGRGTVVGTLLAVLLLSLVPTALTYIGAPPQWRLAIQGAFILAAVVADSLIRPRRVPEAGPS